MDLKKRVILLGIAGIGGILKGLSLEIAGQYNWMGITAENSGGIVLILLIILLVVTTWKYGIDHGLYSVVAFLFGVGIGMKIPGMVIVLINCASLIYICFALGGGP